MKITILILIMASSVVAQTPTPCYYVIYGNQDGSDFYAHIDTDIEVPVWAVTAAIGSGYEDMNGDGIIDSINFVDMPLTSQNDYISQRNGANFYFPFTVWDDMMILPPVAYPSLGFTIQKFLGFCNTGGPDNIGLNTSGDTVHIASFLMRTANDSSLIGQLICPFSFDLTNGVVWSSVITIYPAPTFSCIRFVDYYPGDANGSGSANGLDVNYMVNYFAGFGPSPHTMLAGDANGDCQTNGLDVVYLVNYLKGLGPPPFYGDCY